MAGQLSKAPDEFGVRFTQVSPDTYHVQFTVFNEDDPTSQFAQAEFYLDQVRQIFASNPGKKINFINDASTISSLQKLVNEARVRYIKAYKLPNVGKVAMVGMGPWLKSMIVVFATLAGRASQTAFFDTVAEAKKWIEEKSS